MGTHSAGDRRSDVVVDLGAHRSTEPEPTVSVGVRCFGGWTVVDVVGEMDIQAVALFADLLGEDAAHVVFQLQAVTFMDACGLGLLLESRRHVVAAGGCVRLVAPSRQVHRLLMLTGSYSVFSSFESLLEAVTAPLTAIPQEVS